MSTYNSYILRDEEGLGRLYDLFEAELLHGPLEVMWGPPETRRTLLQNRWYFEILTQICEATGFNKEALHIWYKKKFLGLDPHTIWGETINKTTESKKLTTKAMSEYIKQVERHALEEGVELVYPNYYGDIR